MWRKKMENYDTRCETNLYDVHNYIYYTIWKKKNRVEKVLNTNGPNGDARAQLFIIAHKNVWSFRMCPTLYAYNGTAHTPNHRPKETHNETETNKMRIIFVSREIVCLHLFQCTNHVLIHTILWTSVNYPQSLSNTFE